MSMRLLLFAASLSLCSLASAGVERVGTTSAAFLKLGSGARPAAMGEAYVALAEDAQGLPYNPAGMSQSLAGELAATHTEWFRGLRYENLSSIFSLGDGGMVGATLNFLSVPTITRTEQVANTPDPSLNFKEAGSFTPFDMQGAVAYSRPLARSLMAGATLKLLTQSLDDRSTFGFGLDLGLLYLPASIKGLSAGLAVMNMGTPIKLKKEAFDLPLLMRLGAAYRAFDDKLTFSLEGDVPSDNALVMALGMEYNFADHFYPRLGWRFNSIFNPWSAGFGLHWNPWVFDFSVVPFGELGMTYRASLSWRFGEPGADLSVRTKYLSSAHAKPAVLRPQLAAPDKVTAWAVYIYDSGRPAKIVRQFQGAGPSSKELFLDGKLTGGQTAPEGVYWAVLSARYTTGQSVHSKYVQLEVTNSVPTVDLSLDPTSVNPAAAGEAYVPTSFRPALKSGRGVAEWRVEILDPQGQVFRTFLGSGAFPAQVVWDGKGDKGDALISGQVYQARLWAKDELGSEGAMAAPLSFRAVFR